VRNSEFEQLYADQAGALFAFLAYRLGDRSQAEDVLGEAFERALRARERYDPTRASAKTWLYSIALNCLRDQRRRAAAETRAMERVLAGVAVNGGDGWISRVEDREQLGRALETLSEEEREAIALRYGGELTAPEMAAILAEKLTTVEGRIYRALRKLRDELD
jgi:RNA polymerase sigma-70 factor (ECF subfamily)